MKNSSITIEELKLVIKEILTEVRNRKKGKILKNKISNNKTLKNKTRKPKKLRENEDDMIEVPRDPDIGNKRVTKEVENYLLDKFSEDETQPYTRKELVKMVEKKFSSKYGDLDAHTRWALDMLHTNHLIKRVAPGTWESDDGPDDVYSERETGHAPEGEFVNRGRNFLKNDDSPKNKADFKHEINKAELAVKMLKSLGKDRDKIENMLTDKKFNSVAIKLALKKYFDGTKIDID